MEKNLIYSVVERPKLTEDSVRFDELYFRITENDKEIAHLVTQELVDPLYEELNDPYYFQGGQSIPIAFLGKVNEECRGKGLAGKLLKYANKYHLEKSQKNLYSDEINSPNGARVWEKFVEEGLAEEVSTTGYKRWKMK